MGEVRVHGIFAGPFNKRVELALKLKGVEYEYIEEDRSNKSVELIKYNPVYKQVPVLVHNGKPICESLIILEYIDHTWDTTLPLLPKHPYHRSMARFCAKLIDEKLMGAMYKVCYGKGEEKEKGFDESIEVLKYLDNQLLQGKKFFGGDNIGFVDIVASYIALWFGAIQQVIGVQLLTKQKFPKLTKWIDEFLSCRVVMENLPTIESLVPLYKAQFEAAS